MFGASKSGKAAAAAPAATDPQFNYVTALFNGDGTNGAQNNTFLDSSTNNFTLTRVGTPTQGSAAPFGNNWSNYFATTSDYLYFTDTANFGTGNFTVETWLFYTTTTTNVITAATTGNWQILIYLDGFYWQENGGNLSGMGFTVPKNQWVHLAISRTGGFLNVYVNGTRQYNAANTFNYTSTAARNIGSQGTTSPIYFSNLRFIKGTGIYSGATITVPTAPLTAITGTSLLTCQSTYFKDNSTNNFALTVNGTPSVQRFSPFLNGYSYSPSSYGGSMYFNGTTDYLSLPANSAFNFGTSNLTIEAWIYPTTVSGNIAVFSFAGDIMLFGTQGGIVIWYVNGISSGWAGNTQTVVANQWSHIACVRNGTTCSFYLNGVASTGTSTHSESLGSSSAVFSVGYRSGFSNFTGYISNFRVINGTAVYTSNFVPPTAPLTAITNTALLLNGTNAGIYDSAMITTETTANSAQITTATKQYGTGSIYFPSATSSYLAAPNSPNYAFNQGSFTIEFWVLTSVGSTSQTVIDTRSTTTSTTGIAIGVNTSTGVFVTVNNTTTNFSGISITTWQFVTVIGNGSSYYVWIDGVYKSSISYSVSLTDQFLTIGNSIGKSTSGLIGYIDDLRITKGYSRYTPTVNFTPPTQSFPTS
jgi:hypothetical protein